MNSSDPRGRMTEADDLLQPAGWRRVAARAGRFFLRSVLARLSAADRDTLILDVAALIRSGRLDEADKVLNGFVRGLAADAGFINLCGAVCERRGEGKLAAEFYRIATTVDCDYASACENLRRVRGRGTVARSVGEIALGDAEIRRARHLDGRDRQLTTMS